MEGGLVFSDLENRSTVRRGRDTPATMGVGAWFSPIWKIGLRSDGVGIPRLRLGVGGLVFSDLENRITGEVGIPRLRGGGVWFGFLWVGKWVYRGGGGWGVEAEGVTSACMMQLNDGLNGGIMKTKELAPQELDELEAMIEAALLGFDPFSSLLATAPSSSTTWADLAEDFSDIRWDWSGWLPAGFLTVVASQAGLGKSSLCLHLAASYIDGRSWPDGSAFGGRRGKILWAESESSQALNLQRVKAWGLDLTQIVTPDGDPKKNFKLAGLKGERNKEAARNLINPARREGVRLIILDSLSGLIEGAQSPRAIRGLLGGLADIARDLHVPVLLTHHLRKRTSFDRADDSINLDRLLGSSVISQVPRLIWGLDLPDRADPECRRLSVIKNNLAVRPDPLGFRIDDQGLHFGRLPSPQPSQLEQAVIFFRDCLADGPLPATEVKAAAMAAGVAATTLKRAKKRLRILSTKRSSCWTWELPLE